MQRTPSHPLQTHPQRLLLLKMETIPSKNFPEVPILLMQVHHPWYRTRKTMVIGVGPTDPSTHLNNTISNVSCSVRWYCRVTYRDRHIPAPDCDKSTQHLQSVQCNLPLTWSQSSGCLFGVALHIRTTMRLLPTSFGPPHRKVIIVHNGLSW